MAYSGPAYWSVVYKAVADFGDLLAEAAKAKAALKSLSDEAKAEGAVETEAAVKAAAAHKTDTAAIDGERRALELLAVAAKAAQQWTAWGGRTDPGAYLADQAKTLEYKRLINIQNWLGFTNPQSAYAFRERERLQALEMNKAVWGGYTTPDQYLGYLRNQRSALASLNDVLLSRAQLYRDNASAALSYANALTGSHETAGTLGENLDLTGVNQFQAALSGLPDVVTTRLQVDDAVAVAQLAQYAALLRGVPREVTTTEVVTAAPAGGTALGQPQVIPVSYGGPYQEQFAAIVAEVAQLSRLRVQIPVHFDLPSAAEVASFVSQIPAAGITEPVHLAPSGGPVGVGPGPPPEVIAAWNALTGAESAAASESRLAAAAESAAAESAARAAAGTGVLAAAWATLSDAEKAACIATEANAAAAAAEADQAVKTAAGVGALTAAWEQLSAAEKDAAAGETGLALLADGSAAAKAGAEAGAAAKAWEALSAAEKNARLEAVLGPLPLPGGAGGGSGKPPVPPPAAAAGEPPDDAAAKWAALSAAEKAAAAEADADAVKFAALHAAAAGDADAAGKLTYVYRTLTGDTRTAGAAAAAAAAGFGAFSSTLVTFAGFGTKLALFGGLAGTIGIVHLLIDAIIELIAITVLATAGIAAAAAALVVFGAAGQQAAQQVYQRLKATQLAATATGQAIYPLTGAFAQLQETARPAVWQLYGDALNLVGNHADALNRVVQKTGAYLDQLAAKMIVFASSPGFQQGLKTLVTAGFGVLSQLGDIFRNLGRALVEFAKVAQQTHVAEDLLVIVNAGAALLALVLKLPTPLLAAVVGLHAFYLWGGLLATGLIALLDPLRAVAAGLGGLGAASSLSGLDKNATAFQRLKAVLKDVVDGFAAIPGRLAGVGGAAKAAGADMALAGDEAALMSGEEVAATAATGGLAAAVGGLGTALKGLLLNPVTWLVALAAAAAFAAVKISTARDATQQWIDKMNAGLGQQSLFTVIGKTVADLAAVTQQLTDKQSLNAQATHELSAAQTDLSGKLGSELVHVGDISRAYGVSMPQALGLLQTAGVKTSALFTDQSKVWAAAKVQVAGLVQGYAAMGQGLTQLQGDVSVQLVVGSDQLKQMGQLNTAWDKWLTTVTGGESAVVTFWQNLATTDTNAKAAGASMGGLNTQSLALRSSYNQLIPQAGTVLDQIRQQTAVLQDGAKGSAILTRATRDLAAEMLPLAANNQAARDSLLALVQEADPSINTWQKLTQWVGNLGAAKAAADLNRTMTALETPVSNLAADAAKLTTALQSDLNPAMAAATFNALGGQKAFSTFADDLVRFGPSSAVTIQAGAKVAALLLAVDKNSGVAHDQFVAWAASMDISSAAAEKLWGQVSKLNGTKAQVHVEVDIQAAQSRLAVLKDELAKTTDPAKRHQIELQIQVTDAKLHQLQDELKKLPTSQQIHIQITQYQADIADLEKKLSETTDPAKRHQIQVQITYDQKKIDSLNGSLGSGAVSAGKIRDNLAQGATGADNLAKSGLWAQMRDLTATGFSQIGTFFTKTIPDDAVAMGKSISGAFDVANAGFKRDLSAPVDHWLATTVPSDARAMAGSLSGAWATVAQGFLRDVGGPVASFFTKTIVSDASAMGGALSGDWKSFAAGFMTQFGSPISNFFTKTLGGDFISIGSGWLSSVKGMWRDFSGNVVGNIEHSFLTLVPGWFAGTSVNWRKTSAGMWKDFDTNYVQPAQSFFTKTVPAWFGDVSRWWSGLWSGNLKSFQTEIIAPLASFFTKTVPGWFNDVAKWWLGLWTGNMRVFQAQLISPLTNFFTKTVPGWFGDVGRWWGGLWSGNMKLFSGSVIGGFANFFTHSVPSWFGDVGRWWSSLWTANMQDFSRHVITPIENWFRNSLPNALKTGMRDGIDWVINNVINKTVDFINNDILAHLPGSLHISRVSPVAAGGDIPAHAGGRAIRMPGSGSVPGTGDEDGTHIIAMGGEYMLRKPARMALERTYGSNFLNTLNQADSWLGSGSRGNAASQRPRPARHAAGGLVNPIGAGLKPERIDMGVDYGGSGSLYALGSGQITSTHNSGWPGGGFIGLKLNPPSGSGYWYYAEDVLPDLSTRVGGGVSAGQHIATAIGGSSGIEVGWAAPPGTGQTAAAASGQAAAGQRAGDPGKYPTAWGVAASNLIRSLGGPGGILSGPVQGGTGGLGGIVSAIWQSVEGLLDSAGTGLGKLVSPLSGLVSGGAAGLLKLAKQGAAAIFNGVWDHTVKPLVGVVPGDTIPGALLQAGAADIRQGIASFMSGQDSSAQSNAAAANALAGSPGAQGGPGSASAAQAQAYAASRLSAFGWPQSEMPYLKLLWDQESGWNRLARNPSSGAYGIPQALPGSKMGPEANPPTSSAAAQINWGLPYIKGRYGTPAAAEQHETQYHWYPMGGGVGDAVVGAIEAVTPDENIREAMALGSWLETRWNPRAQDEDGLRFGPFGMELGPGITKAEVASPSWSAARMLPAYTRAVSQVGPLWDTDPRKAAEQSAFLAEQPPRAYSLSQGQGAMAEGWASVMEALGEQAPVLSRSKVAAHSARAALKPIAAALAKVAPVAAKVAAPVAKVAAPVASAAASKASQILSFAESFVGKVPYKWGGTTTSGWDCSGFTDYVYKHFGYTGIPRTSQQQWGWVKRGGATPGGLAFFAGSDGTASSPGHVGIVVNGNEMVDAYGTGYGTRYNTIYGSSGAVSGFGIPPSGFAAGGDVSMAAFPGFAQGDVIAAIESATSSQQIREAMALGSHLESGWNDLATGDSGTSFGPYQIHLPAHPGVTAAEAENAAWATNYMLPAYTTGVNQTAASLWSSNPESAAENAAYLAERPAQTYFASQGTSAVNAAWSAVLSALGAGSSTGSGAPAPAVTPPAPPAAINTGVSYPGHEVRIQPGAQVPWITGYSAGTAHNILTAADMVPTAAAGQQATWRVTGSVPPAGSPASIGLDVAILADPGAVAVPLRVPSLAGYSAGTAHNILAAAGFAPAAVASQQAWWVVTGTSPGAGSTVAAGSTVTIIASPNTVMVPVLRGYTTGAAHNALVAMDLVPTDAAAGTAPGEWNWFCTGTSPAGGTMVAPGSKVAILSTSSSMAPSGAGAAANWPAASAALSAAMTGEIDAFWALNAAPVTGASTDQWAQWYADLGILQTQQNAIAGTSWGRVDPLLATPSGLTTSDWLTFGNSIQTMAGWLQDAPTPPSSVWGRETSVPWPSGFKTSTGATPGHIPPSGWAAWKYANPAWAGAVNAAKTLSADEAAAYGAWQALYGPAGSVTTSPPTPGLQVVPSGGGPVTIDIEALVPGGPAFPVLALQPGSTSATGSGFAGGGMVGGDGISLDDVAGQFAMGGFMPRMPAVQPGLGSLSTSASQDTPRTISAAAGAAGGDRVGVKIGNITVNNPVPEKPSDSITRSSNRLAYLAGRGPV